MAQPQYEDEETILRTVHSWPRERQLALVRRLLDTGLDTLDPITQRPFIPSAALRGLVAGRRYAPSDEEIEQWRQEKHDLRQE